MVPLTVSWVFSYQLSYLWQSPRHGHRQLKWDSLSLSQEIHGCVKLTSQANITVGHFSQAWSLPLLQLSPYPPLPHSPPPSFPSLFFLSINPVDYSEVPSTLSPVWSWRVNTTSYHQRKWSVECKQHEPVPDRHPLSSQLAKLCPGFRCFRGGWIRSPSFL